MVLNVVSVSIDPDVVADHPKSGMLEAEVSPDWYDFILAQAEPRYS